MVQNGTRETLTLAGSKATQNVMGAIVDQFNGDTTANTDPDTAVNLLAGSSDPQTVPGDGQCPTKVYSFQGLPAPNGDDAGRSALEASELNGDGCVDIARSSDAPRPAGDGDGEDLTTFEYYAYALDAVSWTSASSHAPANLTQFQLQDIYDCDVTDWSAVGGTPGPIQRYYPPVSSTRAFFQAEVLGFDPTDISGTGCPGVVITSDESSGVAISTAGDQATAIEPYLASSWVAQANGTTSDTRSGQTIRSIDGAAYVVSNGATFSLNTAGPVKESNVKVNNGSPTNVGVRYVYNVIDSATPSYAAAKYFVGFENRPANDSSIPTASGLCDDKDNAALQAFGFAPLDKTVSAHNLLGSTCRIYQPS
jgi:phosphate transport system substrate-binding protein